MSEIVGRMRRALAQAQGFTKDAPLEAVARVELVVRELRTALQQAPHGARAELEGLLKLAEGRLDKYRAIETGFRQEAGKRADLFAHNERERLTHVIPEKV